MTRVGMTSDQDPLTLQEATALAWLAAKETDPQLLETGLPTDPTNRQKAVLNALLEAQTAYGLGNNPSCWPGTWGRIGTALCGIHKEVFYQREALLTGELARHQYNALIGNELEKIYQENQSTYWAILRETLGSANDAGDQHVYTEWLNKRLPEIKAALLHAAVEETFANTLIQEATRDGIPLLNHPASHTFELLQKFFYQQKQTAVFNHPLKNLDTNSDVDEVLASLKAVYLQHMQVPEHLSEQEKNALDEMRKSVLDRLLTHQENGLSEEETWAIVRTQVKIKATKDTNLSNWYQMIELDKKILFAKEHVNDSVTDKDIVTFALKQACFAGLSLPNGIDLSGFDFRGWDLRGMDFSGVNLKNADLKLIHAEGAKWEGCDLTGAHFNQWLFPEALVGSVHCTPELLAKQNRSGDTVLHRAMRIDNLDALQLILASPHCTSGVLKIKDGGDDTILHRAARHTPDDALKLIVASPQCTSEVFVSQRRSGGDTVLHELVSGAHDEKIFRMRMILASKHCAKVLAVKNNNGWTAYDVATRWWDWDTAHIIRTAERRHKHDFITQLPSELATLDDQGILNLFEEIKDRSGKYSYIHIQRNPTWDRVRLFFKSSSNNEPNFWHTATYQKAVKLLKTAYLEYEDKHPKLTSSRSKEANELIDYVRGNAPIHFHQTSTRKMAKQKTSY